MAAEPQDQMAPELEEGKLIQLLAEEIEEEILLQLPLKSLLRFCQVSQNWNSLILGARFAKTYHLGQEMVAMFGRGPGHMSTIAYPMLNPTAEPFPLATPTPVINRWRTTDIYDGVGGCGFFFCVNNETSVGIWNPAIRESYLEVAPPPVDDLLAHAILGIGLDANFDDFKISLVHKTRSHEGSQWRQIFSLKEKTWKSISSWRADPIHILSPQALCLGSNLFWLVRRFRADNVHPFNMCIDGDESISFFDFSNEVYGELELPRQAAQHEVRNRDIYGGVRYECYLKLASLRGVLCVCRTFFHENKLAIWFREDCFWIRRFEFSLVGVGFDRFGGTSPWYPFSVDLGDNWVAIKSNCHPEYIIVFDRDGMHRIHHPQHFHAYHSSPYVESLRSPVLEEQDVVTQGSRSSKSRVHRTDDGSRSSKSRVHRTDDGSRSSKSRVHGTDDGW